MNKKFLSAILFGALMVASTGTFVSCKDYDDDIDELWDAVGGKASAEDLKNQIDSMKSLLDEASTSAAEAKAAAAEALEKANSAGDPTAAAEAAAKKEAAAAKEEAVKEAQEKINALEKKLTEAMNQKVDQSKFNELSAEVANLQALVEGIAGKQLKSLVFVPELYMDGVESFEAKYMPYKAILLKNGNESEKYNGVTYTTKEANDIAENLATTVTVNKPTMYLDYHMNPTTAKVADFKDNLSFVSDDKDFVATGRAADAKPTAVYKSHDKGVLTVGVNLDGTKVKQQAPDQFIGYAGNQSLITVLALQADVKGEEGDTIVTSDYAGVYASQIKVEAIAYDKNAKIVYTPATDCDEPTTGRHLFKHVKDAIKAEPTVNVAWNSEIDLNTLTCTHYLSNSKSSFGNNGNVKIWANGEEKDYNLVYKYNLVDYEGGANATSESQNAQLNGAVLRPCGVDAATGKASGIQGIETVGRMPMVRVTLHDTQNNDQIVAIGYIKLHIIESETPKETKPFDKGDVYYSCKTQSVKLTWAETQTELLGATAATSKETFDALYQLETVGGVAVQYAKSGENYKVVSAEVGEIKEVVDPTAPTTTCLQWNVEQADFSDLRDLATVNATAKTITYTHTVYVKYVGRSGTGSTGTAKTPIYVPVKVTFNYPYGTLNNKLATRWYAQNTTTNGNDEIHINVEVPKTTVEIEGEHGPAQAACHFHSDLDSYFKVNTTKQHNVGNIAIATAASGDAPSFGVDSKFTEWQDAQLAYVYYFTAANDFRNSQTVVAGNSGQKYNLYIGTDNSIVSTSGLNAKASYDEAYQAAGREYNYDVLWATKDGVGAVVSSAERVAVINQSTGVVSFQDNDYAKDLLNLESHTVLAKTLTAEIGVAAFNECANLLPLADKTFDAKFLRPVDIEQGEVRNFTDAVDGNVESTKDVNGAWAYVLNLVALSDWRDQVFVSEHLDYFNYYEVESITADLDAIETDMDGGWKKLSDVNKSIYFTQEEVLTGLPASTATLTDLRTHYGKLKYFNNTGNTTEFNVRVPLTVSYKWGDITIVVECHIGGTLNN